MLQPSFIPPRDIRVLREYTRLRAELVRERPGHYDDKISTEPKTRNHLRQPQALGMTVTITPAEDAA